MMLEHLNMPTLVRLANSHIVNMWPYIATPPPVCIHERHLFVLFVIGVALLANAPERVPEKRKRGREKDSMMAESRHFPSASSSSKPSSRAARQRGMAQREEQFAAHKVSIIACITTYTPPYVYILIDVYRGKTSNCVGIIVCSVTGKDKPSLEGTWRGADSNSKTGGCLHRCPLYLQTIVYTVQWVPHLYETDSTHLPCIISKPNPGFNPHQFAM